jgi:hypothetical protein
MSALQVIARDQTIGTVVIRDEREDGTVVVLQCEDAGQGRVVAPSSTVDEAANEVYPLARKHARDAAKRLGRDDEFVLILDTTRMPGGPLAFKTGAFTDAARRNSGLGVVTLDSTSALEGWGYIGEYGAQRGDQPTTRGKSSAARRSSAEVVQEDKPV